MLCRLILLTPKRRFKKCASLKKTETIRMVAAVRVLQDFALGFGVYLSGCMEQFLLLYIVGLFQTGTLKGRFGTSGANLKAPAPRYLQMPRECDECGHDT